MGKLTNDEIKEIIKRASILQKFHEQSLGARNSLHHDENDPIYEVGDSLNIKRHFIREALLEYEGIVIDEPVMVDNNSDTQVEILGYANGPLDGSSLNEIRAQLEYHFNTVGTISRRKGNIYWKAKPAFPSKLFEITRSPEFEIQEKNGRVKLTMRQSLKTVNKIYLPPLAFALGGFMMIAAVIFDSVPGNEAAPMFIVGGMFLAGSFAFSRFVRSIKRRKKRKLLELVETIQQGLERRFRAGRYKDIQKPEIDLEEFQHLDDTDDIEITMNSRIKE